MMEHQTLAEFKENAIFRIDESMRMIQISLMNIDDQDVWDRPNSQSNSIGNLLLHLAGNIKQYGVSSLGNMEDTRRRDIEFTTNEGHTKDELFQHLYAVVENAKQVLSQANSEEMLRKRLVQGFNFSGIGIVLHMVEHLSYHTGQIAFWVKQIREKDLGFYRGMDLNTKNES